ncbi:hypothetical protein N7540_010803 [Penicillium herquei]|nr:hypothetical protein N7540_010803 [Penicillium herquei]
MPDGRILEENWTGRWMLMRTREEHNINLLKHTCLLFNQTVHTEECNTKHKDKPLLHPESPKKPNHPPTRHARRDKDQDNDLKRPQKEKKEAP